MLKPPLMGISTRVNFEVIEPRLGSNSYPELVSHPWGINMKENISLDKQKIKIKGIWNRFIIPLDPREGKPWDEPDDKDADV
jgi:hypothetical protein